LKLETRYSVHPEHASGMATDELRRHFLIETVFLPDEVNLVYSHIDRVIAGGAMPVERSLTLSGTRELGSEYFLERRELGVINVGGPGAVLLDGVRHELAPRDGLYAGMEIREVIFKSLDREHPAKFYLNSAPAHMAYPAVHIGIARANPVHTGSPEQLNLRTIYQFIHPAVCKSCQLVMGMTVLEPGSVWNTMPCHTHDRRMEVYFYFNMKPDTRVFHLMGEPNETRHMVMANEQAVLSPSWSIHAGVATADYTFIWGMCGENQTFTDMDNVPMDTLR